jgi:hypothetical protein
MGVESANYQYVPTRESAELLAGTLDILGAWLVDDDNERIVQYVLRGNDYWIDVEVMCAGGLTYPSASIRVALCNPPGVALALRNLLETLLKRGAGYIIDRPGDRKFRAIDDETWQQLWEAYELKRVDFRQHFGGFEAAVSGADVFRIIREGS